MESYKHSKKRIIDDLLALGVQKGDTLFLRISYRAVGKTEGGPITIVKALEEVVGEDGTLIMTGFPKKHIRQLRWFFRNDVHSINNIAKPVTGVLPTLSLELPEARISQKLEFPFIVIGKNADYLTSNHTHEIYGYWLLQEAIEKFNCKCLRIGGEPFVGSTHIAFDEVFSEFGCYQKKLMNGLYLEENKKKVWREQQGTVFCRRGFKDYADNIISYSLISKGKVGNGDAFLTSMSKSLEFERRLFRNDIRVTLCKDPDCLYCRTSFSFSDGSNWTYLKRQLNRLLTKDRLKATKRIYALLRNTLFGIKIYGK